MVGNWVTSFLLSHILQSCLALPLHKQGDLLNQILPIKSSIYILLGFEIYPEVMLEVVSDFSTVDAYN